ncbi:hypothetical protein BTS2_3755 [Bacillus sp. TS-2]|nr:hypothetical protein BTS2_3755 [Bacillus sp. TS-2]
MSCCSPRYYVNENGFLQSCPKRSRKSFCSIVTPSFLYASNELAVLTSTDTVTPVLIPWDEETIRTRGFIISPDFNQVASENSGIYNASYNLTLSSSITGVVTARIAVNGVPVAGTERTVTLVANTPQNVSVNNLPITLFSGQIVSLQLVTSTAASTVTVTDATFNLNRIANLGGR